MFTIAIIAISIGVTLSFTSHNGVVAEREQDFNRALNAADGALDYAFASWKQAVRNNGLRAPTNSQIATGGAYAIAAPAATLHTGFQNSGVTFSNFSVVNANQWGETKDASNTTIASPVSAQLATIPGHPGWAGVASFYRAKVTATVPSRKGPISVTLARTFQITGIPVFQAAIFFEHDIELHPGALMIIRGLVHSNNDLWFATGGLNNLQFLSNVSYVGAYHELYKPNTTFGGGATGSLTPYVPIWADGLTASTSATVANQLLRTDRMEPFGTEPASLYNTTDTNPNNDGPRELIEPPVTTGGATDPAAIASTRLYNQATVRVTIDRTKTGTAQVAIRNGSDAAFSASVDTAIRNAINVSTTTIYDWREASNVALTNVDMRTLDTALVGMGSTFNGVFYIQDVTPTGLNAVRLRNGAVLNRDLTVASNNGVYIQGDYNTGGVTGTTHDPLLVPSNNGGNPTGTDSTIAPGYTKRSTAVIADAIMMLSNSWNDANSTAALSGRIASHTTVNTAILSGIVPTNYQNSGVYSGGPHNFPRFLEDWSGQDFTYLGSMVQTFNSTKFDGIYGSANVYGVPGRKWGFDTQFLTQPPPGTLQNVAFSRGRWERL